MYEQMMREAELKEFSVRIGARTITDMRFVDDPLRVCPLWISEKSFARFKEIVQCEQKEAPNFKHYPRKTKAVLTNRPKNVTKEIYDETIEAVSKFRNLGQTENGD